MANKLTIWQQALIHLEAASINSLDDDVLAVNVFNKAWPGVVEEALTEGNWSFAQATVELAQSSTGTASLGWSYVYDFPDDYDRTIMIHPTTRFDFPFTEFIHEDGYIHSSTTPLYMRYVRDLADVAYDVDTWPTSFWRYVAMKLAFEACGRITQSTTLEDKLEKRMEKALKKARNQEARKEPFKKVSSSSWLDSRSGQQDGQGGGVNISANPDIVLSEGDI